MGPCPPTTPCCCWRPARPGSSRCRIAGAAVTRVCSQLAEQLLADAEGSTKEIAIEVVHAASEDDAVEVGRSVARNNLVKTAFFGQDANWGRILAAVGTVGTACCLRRRRDRRGHQRGLDLQGRRHR